MTLARFVTAFGLCAVLLATTATRAHAADDERRLSGRWALCGAPLTPPPRGDPARREAADTPTTIDAGTVRYRGEGEGSRYTLLGDPVITRADQRIAAERVEYDGATGEVAAEGDVRYDAAGVVLEGDRGRFNLQRDTGRFASAKYRVEAGHLHGEAAEIEVESRTTSRYRDVTLTTCAPGDEDWWLHASELTIDRAARQGQAFNAWLELGNLPVFYTPYISFPIGSARKTGFLAPSAGYSDDGGAELSLPWYWNIAPNYDATFTPSYYARRGGMLGAEFRYLLPRVTGEIGASYLPDDSAFGADRWSIDQDHRLAIGEHLRGELIQQRVSDDDYLDDFGDSFDDSAETSLESRVATAYSTTDWSFSADAQSWQTIDETVAPQRRPYEQQPRLRFRYDPLRSAWPVTFALESEAVQFRHPFASQVDTGRRIDLTPRVSAPLETLGYFVIPSVALRHTQYELERPNPSQPDQPERTLPIYSLDAGVAFERDLQVGGRDVIQTFEPRLFYLNVPFRDQSELPVFDTRRATFTFGQLFRENRFIGADRVGDTEQLSAGVTTRFLDQATGTEYLGLSAGQIFYFEDREVTLSDEAETDGESDYVAELRADSGGGLKASVDFRWDPDSFGNRELRSRFQWRGGPEQVLNLDYRARQRQDKVIREEGGVSFGLPLGARWHVIAGWNYDLIESQTQERFAGLEFESCCYAIRAVHRGYLARDDGEDTLDTQILLELELKGLGGVGDRILDFAEEAIRGYSPIRY